MPASYMVPNVPLIAQDQSLSCWYASAQMVIQWRRERRQMTEMGLLDPSEVPATVNLYKANNVLPWGQIYKFSRILGLKDVPLMTPTQDAVAGWLRQYGPIWAAGKKVTPAATYGHVVVIAGVSPTGYYIHDPEPMNTGWSGWKPVDWLTTTLEWGVIDWNLRNFLHCPR